MEIEIGYHGIWLFIIFPTKKYRLFLLISTFSMTFLKNLFLVTSRDLDKVKGVENIDSTFFPAKTPVKKHRELSKR